MSISIQTNVNSLVAQQNMNVNSAFQSKTIQQLTSGYRINQSGDDAAGLAVANKFRSSVAELTQGVANGNDGLAQLQIMDGGMGNISQILDRLKTLATQSASGAFTGNRTDLNTEFQNDLTEIDRQAQSIGLNAGGTFARSLDVFLGQGSGSASPSNGIVTLNLAGSTVDSQSLGMKGLQAVATGTALTALDLGGGAATSVSNIVGNGNNAVSEATPGSTDFYFVGPGFSDASAVKVSVNLTGVTDTSSLVAAINSAIAKSGDGTTQAGANFASAGIVASVNIDSASRQQLAFTSNSTAFQVEAGDKMANALMGNFKSGSAPEGADIKTSVVGAATSASTWDPSGDVTIRIQGGGLAGPVDLKILATENNGDSTAAINDLAGKVASSAALMAAGISMTGAAGGALTFTSATGQSFNVMATGDTHNQLGFGSFATSATLLPVGGSGVDYTSIQGNTANSTTTAQNQADLEFSINGAAAAPVTIDLGSGPSATAAVFTSSAINNPAVGANTALAFSVDGINVTGDFATLAAGEKPSVSAAAGVGVIDSGGLLIHAATTSVTTGSAAITPATNWATGPSSFTVNVNGAGDQTIYLSMNYTGTAVDGDLQTMINSQLKGATVSIASGVATFTASAAGGDGAAGIVIGGAALAKLDGGGTFDKTLAGADGNNKIMVAVDGGVAQEVDVLNGSTTPVTLAQDGSNLTAFNAALSSQGVTASIDGSTHQLVLTSSTRGSGGSVTVSNVPAGADSNNSGMTTLFGATTTLTDHGSDFNAASIQSTVQGWINSAISAAGATGVVGATVTVDSGNHIIVTNDNKGAAHTLGTFSGSAATNWFGNAAPTAGTNMSGTDLQNYLNQQFSSIAALKPAQLQATWTAGAGSAGKLTIASGNNTNFRVNSGATASGTLTGGQDLSGGHNFSTIGGANQSFKINVDGAGWSANPVTLTGDDANAAAVLDDLKAALETAGVTGVTASLDTSGKHIVLTSDATGSTSSIQVEASGTSALDTLGFTTAKQTSDADLGFGVSGASFTSTALATAGASANMTTAAAKNYFIDAGGASSANVYDENSSTKSNALSFGALQFGNDSQAIAITATGADGVQHSQTITLANIQTSSAATTNQSGRNIDEAISYINKQLQSSNVATMKQITAVKENNLTGDQINFISSLASFNVSVGSTANSGSSDGVHGGVSQNYTLGVVGSGSNLSIDTEGNAKAAVTAITAAVSKLGSAQAAVGKGENQLGYAISLAQSQITNFSAAESQIRDANIAQQAANMTKAQVLQQANIAAMAQANSAPQAVLKLLQG